MARQLEYRKCWSSELLDRYFTTEAMSKDRQAFLKVHLPINEIIVDEAYPASSDLGGKSSIGEEDLLDLVMASRPSQPNRIFVLVGETGSGKSELCQWLSYRIEDGVHVPILIARSMIHLRDIVAEINKHLGEDVPDDIRDVTDLWPETISKNLVAAMFRRLERPEVRNRVSKRDAEALRSLLDQREFEHKMRQNFIDYRMEIRRLDKPRELNLLPEKDFGRLAADAGGLKHPAACYAQLQRAMTDCLADELQVEDLIEKLSEIARRYRQQGRRPVLLIEDITTWGFLQNDLLDYLFDLSSGSYDVVIGVTTGFERSNQDQIYKSQQTITERIEGRFELTDETGETVFLRRDYASLVRLYLNAVKEEVCESCGSVAECHEVFGTGLYPFTREFLQNVYKNLEQDGNPKQTPRLLLRAVRHCLEAEASPPFESIELVNYVDHPPTYFARSPGLSPVTERLFKWYGVNTKEGVFLPVALARFFGLSSLALPQRSDGHYRLLLRAGVEGLLPDPPKALSHLVGRVKEEPEEQPAEDEPTVEEKKETEAGPTPEDLERAAAVDILGEMDQWLNHKGNFPRRDTFKDGVLALVDFFRFTPFEMKHSHSIAQGAAPLTFKRGNRRSRIYLHQSGDTLRPGYFKLTIEPDADQQDLFSQVLAVGLDQCEVTDTRTIGHVQLHDWLQGLMSELQQDMKASLRDALGMPLTHFILMTKFLLLNNAEGLVKLDPYQLVRPIAGEPLELQPSAKRINHLFECRDHIDALFVAFFHLRDNVVDFPLLRRTVESLDPDKALRDLERIDPEGVPNGFEIHMPGDDLPLQGLARLVRDYASSLRRYQQNAWFKTQPPVHRLVAAHRLCDPPDDLDPEDLRAQVDELRRLAGALGLRWQRRWDIELDALHSNPDRLDFSSFFKILTEAVRKGESLEEKPDVFAFVAAQRLVSHVAKTPEYEVLEGLKELAEGIAKAIRGRGGSLVQSSRFQRFSDSFQQYQGAL